jgi:hypothetical protein
MVTDMMIEEAIRVMQERGVPFTEDDARAVWEAMNTAAEWKEPEDERAN